MSESAARRALRRGKDYWNRWVDAHRESEEFDWDVAMDLCGVRLSGQDLRGYDLSKVSMKEASLRKANLSGAVLTEANLSGSDFEGADLSDCDLSYTNMTGANLQNTRLSSADLTWAILRDANLRNADLTGACLVQAILEGSDIQNARLDNIEITSRNNEDPALGQFLELAACKNLETVRISDPQIVVDYLADAFDYVHEPHHEVERECPDFFHSALDRITALNRLSNYGIPPSGLIDVVKLITDELIKYLKSHPKALYEIRPRQFEELIAGILKSFGWVVELTPETRDGGYDLFAICSDCSGLRSRWIIECKKYAATRTVGVDIVRSLYGVKAVQRGANALLATTSFFSSEAYKYKSSRYDLQLRDFNGVMEWIKHYRVDQGKHILAPDNKVIVPD